MALNYVMDEYLPAKLKKQARDSDAKLPSTNLRRSSRKAGATDSLMAGVEAPRTFG